MMEMAPRGVPARLEDAGPVRSIRTLTTTMNIIRSAPVHVNGAYRSNDLPRFLDMK